MRPQNVVRVVITTGRKRRCPACMAASKGLFPAPRSWFVQSIRTRASLTTTPAIATILNKDMRLMDRSNGMWPKKAPTMPNGIALMMMRGCT